MIIIKEFFQSTFFSIEFYKTNILNVIGILISLYIAKKSRSLKNELTSYKNNITFKKKLSSLIKDLRKFINDPTQSKSSIDISREIASLSAYKEEFKSNKKNYRKVCELIDFFTKVSNEDIVSADINIFKTNIYNLESALDKKKGELE